MLYFGLFLARVAFGALIEWGVIKIIAGGRWACEVVL